MDKRCPLLSRFSIPESDSENPEVGKWETITCLYFCPLTDLCFNDFKGITLKMQIYLVKQLRRAIAPCPKCQLHKPTADLNVKSGLEKTEDGWACVFCGHIIYNQKPLPLTRGGHHNK